MCSHGRMAARAVAPDQQHRPGLRSHQPHRDEVTMPDGSPGLHVPAGDGEAWWFLATRMTVLVDPRRSGGSLTLALQESPAGFGPPRHVHEAEDEAFFV